jgi:hypothetical protein
VRNSSDRVAVASRGMRCAITTTVLPCAHSACRAARARPCVQASVGLVRHDQRGIAIQRASPIAGTARRTSPRRRCQAACRSPVARAGPCHARQLVRRPPPHQSARCSRRWFWRNKDTSCCR